MKTLTLQEAKKELEKHCATYGCELIDHGKGHFAIIGDKQRVNYWPISKRKTWYGYGDKEMKRFVDPESAVILATNHTKKKECSGIERILEKKRLRKDDPFTWVNPLHVLSLMVIIFFIMIFCDSTNK